VITLQGELDETQRAQLLQDASKSPVTRTLGVSADIRTRYSISDEYISGSPASYATDLRELSDPEHRPGLIRHRQRSAVFASKRSTVP
jgi:hypothetical protein